MTNNTVMSPKQEIENGETRHYYTKVKDSAFCQFSQGIDWNYTLSICQLLLFSQGIDSPRYTLG